MKIAIINDTHWGARSDNNTLIDYYKLFLDTVFFPTIQKQKIKTIFHLGDLVDRRKYVNFNTVNRMKEDFFKQFSKYNIENCFIIPGNHDTYYKNTNRVNALNELLEGMSNVTIINEPTELKMGNLLILMLPWICDENKEASLAKINETKASVCFGHLELKGFEMHKGSFSEVGFESSVFDKFELVGSGHYHHKSTYSNIHYLGNPFEMTWSDYGDTKGFHIFDTSTRELTFIQNPYKLFTKIHYLDQGKTFDEVMNVDFDQYKGTYVKVIVATKENPFWYDSYIQKLEDAGPIDVQAVEDHLNLNLEDGEDIINQAESTFEILKKTISTLEINKEYEKPLENLLRTLYNEANVINS